MIIVCFSGVSSHSWMHLNATASVALNTASITLVYLSNAPIWIPDTSVKSCGPKLDSNHDVLPDAITTVEYFKTKRYQILLVLQNISGQSMLLELQE